MEECKETRIHGRLGWKAIPFALDDLDSWSLLCQRSVLDKVKQQAILTNLVSMFGEDCMFG